MKIELSMKSNKNIKNEVVEGPVYRMFKEDPDLLEVTRKFEWDTYTYRRVPE